MAGKSVITERHIQDAKRAGHTSIVVPAGCLVTPLAKDAARQAGISISTEAPKPQNSSEAGAPPDLDHLIVCIGSDHGGYDMKQDLIAHLNKANIRVVDVGVDSPRSCDYPDYAYAVAKMVSDQKAGLGIMIDGVGVGSSIACNKVPGIRAACAYNEFAAWNARAHNNANVLTLGSRSMAPEVVKRIVDVFLKTAFEGGRHERRVSKIRDLEERYSR